MRINFLNFKTPAFKGRREDRNTANQLKTDNDYALTENNQNRINQAIDNLAKEKGENNIKFLLEVAQNLKYGTQIDTGLSPKNDWKKKLYNAANSSLAASDPILQSKYKPEIERVFNPQKPLSQDEKDILASKENILKNMFKSELKDEKNANILNVERNLNYFIISSEVPLKQKKYILNRFEYLLSPDYHINPQLKDKKTVVLAELLNDLVIDAKTSKTPNTKAINQRSHGMCAAISISRKLMSYEYQPKYVDAVLSELDDTNEISVYDLAHPGEGKKVSVPKIEVDFNEASNRGYRIIDASTTQWMNIADMYGLNNKQENIYTAFDPEHFSTFEDTHYSLPLEDETKAAKHTCYQALLKAKENVDMVKAEKLKSKFNHAELNRRLDTDVKMLQDLSGSLRAKLSQVLPSLSDNELHSLINDLYTLQVNTSLMIEKKSEDKRKYSFLPNEEDSVKTLKIKSYLEDKFNDKTVKPALEKNIADIKDLMEMSKSITESIKPESTITKKIQYDRKLFAAAAAFRTSMIMAMRDNDLRTNYMVHYNLPDSEKLLLDNMEKVVSHIKNTGDKRYLNHFSNLLGIEPDKDAIAQLLADLKNDLEYSLTEEMDEFYTKLGIDGRKSALEGEIKTIINNIKDKDKSELDKTASTLGIEPKKSKVLEILEKYETILSNGATEEQYTEIFNKIGLKNRLTAFADSFNLMAEAMDNPKDDFNAAIIKEFNANNNIPPNAPLIESKRALQMLSQEFNGLSSAISQIRDSLDIYDEAGNLLNTANPNTILIKQFEKENQIQTHEELDTLYKRYSAIDKLRSSDEFSSRQGKIADPSLYKYTNSEKETLKKIDKSLLKVSAHINKELNYVYKELKPDLEEHVRKIGVNTGAYWVRQDGSSGLDVIQQSKILQQLTDTPYYPMTDLQRAVDIIKKTAHSGISSSSVFHDKPGWHAQYVSEIAAKDGKDILFHDNSWGASEHENIWVDSEGLTRTDYSDRRGGALGYITDDKWRNGNYVQNILGKTGENKPNPIESHKLKKLADYSDRESYKFPLMSDIILQGINPEANNIAAGIKDNIFVPDTEFINEFEKNASKLSLEEIKASRMKDEAVIKLYQKESEEIRKRLEITPFDKKITTKAEFDALPDNDILKTAFEKAAIQLSSPKENKSYWKEMAKINTVSGLDSIRKKQREDAKANFDYAFSKDPEILYAYALNKNKNHVLDILNNALDNNNIKLTEEEKSNVIISTAMYKDESALFDGSLKNTINFMVNKLLRQFDSVVPESENSAKAKEEIKSALIKDMQGALYFNKKDIEKDTPLHEAIKNYIDNKFNPETDEEFVEIYRKMQDMTSTEFKALTGDVKDSDLALKNYSGFDIVQMYRASDRDINSTIGNIVYQKYLVDALELSKTDNTYQYKKLQKKIRGAYYKEGRTFDDLYKSFNNSLVPLTYEKLFNKNKQDALQKYGVMPAYPKINVLNEKTISEKTDLLDKTVYAVSEGIRNQKITLYAYDLTQRIDNYLSIFDNNGGKKLNTDQRKILNNLAGEFITANYGDKNIARSIDSASKMLELPADAPAEEYKKVFAVWKKEIEAIKKLNPEAVLVKDIKDNQERLKISLNIVVNSDFPVKYRNDISKSINEWINEEIRHSVSEYDKILQRRIIENKLETYAVDSANKNARVEFINNLEMYIKNIQKIKVGVQDNSVLKQNSYLETLNSMLAAADDFVIENEKEGFGENITAFISGTEKHSKEDVEKFLLSEISKYSKLPQEQIKSKDSFKKLSKNMLNYINLNIASIKLRESFEVNRTKLEDIAGDYITKHIKPFYQDAFEVSLKEYISSSFSGRGKREYNEDLSYTLHEKYIKDYKKYYILNYPEEILDRFTALCAKNGEIASAKTEKEKSNLIEEKKTFKNYLITSLSLASLVEMQSLLMEAAELGNPALVSAKFKNFDTGFFEEKSFAPVTMADDKMTSHMVRTLILDNDLTTPVLFVKKLGLASKFLKAETDLLHAAKIKKQIKKLANIITVTRKQNQIFQEEIKKFDESFDTCSDWQKRIDDAKLRIIKKTKNMPRQNNVKLMLGMLDEIKIQISESPDIPKSNLSVQGLNFALSKIASKTNEDIRKIQSMLDEKSTIFKLINKINTDKDEEAQKLKDAYIAKYQEILDYNTKIMSESVKNDDDNFEVFFEEDDD